MTANNPSRSRKGLLFNYIKLLALLQWKLFFHLLLPIVNLFDKAKCDLKINSKKKRISKNSLGWSGDAIPFSSEVVVCG